MANSTSVSRKTSQKYWKPTVKEKRLPDEIVDMVVDAYVKGINDGYKEAKSIENRMLSKAFEKNLENAMSLSASVADKIEKTFSIRLGGLYLKIESKVNFKVALILPVKFYLSDNRRKLTEMLIDSEVDNNNGTFDIAYTVLPNKKSLNLQKLFLDGFIFHYVKKNQPRKKA